MEFPGSIRKRCVCASILLLCCMIMQMSVFAFREIPDASPLQDTGSMYIAETMDFISSSAVTQRTRDYRSLSHLPSINNTAAVLCAALAPGSGVLSCAGLISDITAGRLPGSSHSPNTVSRK